MKTVFTSRFLKDLDKLSDNAVKSAVADVIEAVEKAPNQAAITDLKN